MSSADIPREQWAKYVSLGLTRKELNACTKDDKQDTKCAWCGLSADSDIQGNCNFGLQQITFFV